MTAAPGSPESAPEAPAGEVPPRGLTTRIGALLRAGLLAAALLLVVGLLLYSASGADSLGRFVLSSLPSLDSPYGVAVAFLFAGVLVLALTPVVRVGLAVSAFAREGNGRYVAATLFVLLLLITTVVVGAYE